jgi:hypothetical protein
MVSSWCRGGARFQKSGLTAPPAGLFCHKPLRSKRARDRLARRPPNLVSSGSLVACGARAARDSGGMLWAR